MGAKTTPSAQSESSGTPAPRVRVHRKRHLRTLAFWLSAFVVVVAGRLLQTPADDFTWVQSGEYRFLQVNSDGSFQVAQLDQSDTVANVHWLGVDILNARQTKEWADAQLRDIPSILIRFDRRRLNDQGQLEAYFFLGDRLLNAELVAQGLAKESTHPSDFAAIARQIRTASP